MSCFPVSMAIILTTMFLHELDGVNLDPPQGLSSQKSTTVSSHTAGQELSCSLILRSKNLSAQAHITNRFTVSDPISLAVQYLRVSNLHWNYSELRSSLILYCNTRITTTTIVFHYFPDSQQALNSYSKSVHASLASSFRIMSSLFVQ